MSLGKTTFPLSGVSQIDRGACTAGKNYYLSHIILLTVQAQGIDLLLTS